MGYFSLSDILLLVLQDNLKYVFTWKKITIFLFIDILETKLQFAIWGQQVHLLLSQVRCPGTVPDSVSCLKWQLPVPSRLEWAWTQGHWDATLGHTGIPLWNLKSTPSPSLELTTTAWALWYGQKNRFSLLEQGWPLSLPQAVHSVCELIIYPLSPLSATLTTPLAYCSLFPNEQQAAIFPWLPVLLRLYANKVLLILLPRHWWPCRTMGRKVPALLSSVICDSWPFLMYILLSHL